MTANAGDRTNLKIEADKPWYAAYPVPQTSASSITRESLLSWIKDGKRAGKDFVLVDLRRTDYEVCLWLFIPRSHNYAQKQVLLQPDLLCFLGWNYPRVNQSSCAVSSSYHSVAIYLVLDRWDN
jgi:hypothetical protein